MAEPNLRATTELIRRARLGDTESMRDLLERYTPRLLSRLRAMLGEPARRHAESTDFLQGVFVEILERFDQFEPRDDAAFVRWACQIARNNIRDAAKRPHTRALRRFAERDEGKPSTDTPTKHAVRKEDAARLRVVLASLSEDHRTVIQLRDYEGLGFAEIGQRMGRSANAAKTLHA